MYTRSYNTQDGITAPENYDGCAFPEAEEVSADGGLLAEENAVKVASLKDSILSGSILSRLRLADIDSEDLIILIVAAFLFFSKNGDKQSALMLLILLLID